MCYVEDDANDFTLVLVLPRMTRRRTASVLVLAVLISLNVLLLAVQQRRAPHANTTSERSAVSADPTTAPSLYPFSHDQAPDTSIDPRRHSSATWRFSFNPYETPDPCPDTPDFVEAMTLHQKGRYAEAATAFARVTEKDPGCAAAHGMRSICLMRVQRLEEAEDAAWAAVAASPTEHNRTNLALVLFAAKKVPEAARQYREVLRKNSKNFVALKNLANLLYLQDDVDECCLLLERMMACYPTDSYAYLTLSQIRHRQNRLREAVEPSQVCAEVTEMASRLNPRNVVGRLLYTRPEDDGRAVAAMRVFVGHRLVELGEYDEAVASFRSSLEASRPLLGFGTSGKMRSQTLWGLGLALSKRGRRDHRRSDLEDAVPLLQEAIASSRRDLVGSEVLPYMQRTLAATEAALASKR